MRNNVTNGIAGVSKYPNFQTLYSLPHFSTHARNPVCHAVAKPRGWSPGISRATRLNPPPITGAPRTEMNMARKSNSTASANPIYRITNRETAMAYFRANALTRLMTADGC
jgi:hypothetical protein